MQGVARCLASLETPRAPAGVFVSTSMRGSRAVAIAHLGCTAPSRGHAPPSRRSCIRDAVIDTIASFSDEGFLARLPSLREGLRDHCHRRARQRLLRVLRSKSQATGHPMAMRCSSRLRSKMAAFAAADLPRGQPSMPSDCRLPPSSTARPSYPSTPRAKVVRRRRAQTPCGRRPMRSRPVIGCGSCWAVSGRSSRGWPGELRRARQTVWRGEGEGSNDAGEGGGNRWRVPSVRLWSGRSAPSSASACGKRSSARAAERGTPGRSLELDPPRFAFGRALEQISLAERRLSEVTSASAPIVRSIVDAWSQSSHPRAACS